MTGWIRYKKPNMSMRLKTNKEYNIKCGAQEMDLDFKYMFL